MPLRYREWVEKKNPPLGRVIFANKINQAFCFFLQYISEISNTNQENF